MTLENVRWRWICLRIKCKQLRNFSGCKGHMRRTFLFYFANSSWCMLWWKSAAGAMYINIHFYLGKIERNRSRNAARAGLTGLVKEKIFLKIRSISQQQHISQHFFFAFASSPLTLRVLKNGIGTGRKNIDFSHVTKSRINWDKRYT